MPKSSKQTCVLSRVPARIAVVGECVLTFTATSLTDLAISSIRPVISLRTCSTPTSVRNTISLSRTRLGSGPQSAGSSEAEESEEDENEEEDDEEEDELRSLLQILLLLAAFIGNLSMPLGFWLVRK